MLKITSFGGKNWTFRDQPGWKEGTPTQNNHVKVHYKCKQLVCDEKKTSAKIGLNHPKLTQCAECFPAGLCFLKTKAKNFPLFQNNWKVRALYSRVHKNGMGSSVHYISDYKRAGFKQSMYLLWHCVVVFCLHFLRRYSSITEAL